MFEYFSLSLIFQILGLLLLGQIHWKGALGGLLYLIVCFFLLEWRIRGKKANDFFALPEGRFKEIESPKSLLLGKWIELQKTENEKEDRYLRISSLESQVNIKASLLLALMGGAPIYFSLLKGGNVAILFLSFIVIPISRTYRQLIFAPSLFFVGSLFYGPADEITLTLFLDFLFKTFLLMLSFFTLQGLDKKKSLKDYLQGFTQFFDFLIPLGFFLGVFFYFGSLLNQAHQPKAPSDIEKLNHRIGRKFVSQEKLNFINSTQQILKKSHQLPDDFLLNHLDKMEKSLDKMENFLEMLSKVENLSLPQSQGEMNILINTQKSLKRELTGIKDELKYRPQGNKEIVEKILDLERKMKSFDLDNKKLGFPKFSNNENLEELINKSSQNTLLEGVQNKESLVQITKDENISLNEALKEIESSEDSLNRIFQKAVDKKKQAVHREQSKIQEETPLIDPKILENLIEILLKFIGLALVVAILSTIKKFLSEPEIEGLDEGLDPKEKRKLLVLENFNSSDEEVRILYQRFLMVVKKLHYSDDEEPPPPKLILEVLKELYKKKQNSLAFLVEVFSLSEYGGRKISPEHLKKFRRAYKNLIKTL